MSSAVAAAIIALAISGQPAPKGPEIRCKVKEEVTLTLVLDADGYWVPTHQSTVQRVCGRSAVRRRGFRSRP